MQHVDSRGKKMKATVVGLVTPHLLRIVDLANEAQKGVNVDWQQVVKGLVLLGAVIFDVYNKNKA